MSRYDRRLQTLEAETRDRLAIGWPVCEGERVVAYLLQGKRLDRQDDESDSDFERRMREASTADCTVPLSPTDANL